jgi:hypothetical protein
MHTEKGVDYLANLEIKNSKGQVRRLTEADDFMTGELTRREQEAIKQPPRQTKFWADDIKSLS